MKTFLDDIDTIHEIEYDKQIQVIGLVDGSYVQYPI